MAYWRNQQADLRTLIQQSLLKLCLENVSYGSRLDVDGIICVSTGDDDKQIVVKVHETLTSSTLLQSTSSQPKSSSYQYTYPPQSSYQSEVSSSVAAGQSNNYHSSSDILSPPGGKTFQEYVQERSTSTTLRPPSQSLLQSTPKHRYAPPAHQGGRQQQAYSHSSQLSYGQAPATFSTRSVTEQENALTEVSYVTQKRKNSRKPDNVKRIRPSMHVENDDETVEVSSDDDMFEKPVPPESHTLPLYSNSSNSGTVTSGSFQKSPIDMVLDEQSETAESTALEDSTNAQSTALKTMPGRAPVCRQCRTTFGSVNELRSHNYSMHLRYTCDYCFRTFSHKNNLTRHRKMHLGQKPFSCPVCKMTFARKDYLVYHSLRHEKATALKCGICGEGGDGILHIRKHIASVHRKVISNVSVCTTCNLAYPTSKELWTHKQQQHSEDYLHHLLICSRCSKSFSTALSYKKHALCHIRKKGIKCRKCMDQVYYDEAVYMRHLETHRFVETDIFECIFCGVVHETFDEMSVHENCHFKDDSSDLPCPFCGDFLPDSEQLYDHCRTHGEGNVITCCDASFTSELLYQNHVFEAHTQNNILRYFAESNLELDSSETNQKVQEGSEKEDEEEESKNQQEETWNDKGNHKKRNSPTLSESSEKVVKQEPDMYGSDHSPTDISAMPLLAARLTQNESPKGRSPTTPSGGATENYTCTFCHVGYDTFARYDYHCSKEHGRYPCPFCDKTFSAPSNRTRHRESHGSNRRFECSACSKTFTRGDHFRIHVSKNHAAPISTEEGEFMCALCSERSESWDVMERHVIALSCTPRQAASETS